MRKNCSKDYLIELKSKEDLNRNTVTECSCLWNHQVPPQNARKKIHCHVQSVLTLINHASFHQKANDFVKFVKKPKEFKKTFLKLKFDAANSNIALNVTKLVPAIDTIVIKIAQNYLRRQKTLAVPCCLKSCIYCSSRSP